MSRALLLFAAIATLLLTGLAMHRDFVRAGVGSCVFTAAGAAVRT